MKTLIVDKRGDTFYAALIEDGSLKEYLTGGGRFGQICGNVYLGRVERVNREMGTAFVNVGLSKNAMLSAQDVTDRLRPGDEVCVQVSKLPGGEKGALVTTDIRLAGRMCVLLPKGGGVGISKRIEDPEKRERLHAEAMRLKPEEMGLILRTAAGEAETEALKADIKALSERWERIHTRSKHVIAPCMLWDESDIAYKAARDMCPADADEILTEDEDIYNRLREQFPELSDRIRLERSEIGLYTRYALTAQTEKAKARKVWLRSGGFLIFDRTEAFTVIDVNTGRFSGKSDPEQTVFETNREAACEIALQLRLRDIGGIILVDFIDMALPEHRQALLAEMNALFREDAGRARALDLTALGIMEITRKKKHEEPVFME